jgi:hypothetical protein
MGKKINKNKFVKTLSVLTFTFLFINILKAENINQMQQSIKNWTIQQAQNLYKQNNLGLRNNIPYQDYINYAKRYGELMQNIGQQGLQKTLQNFGMQILQKDLNKYILTYEQQLSGLINNKLTGVLQGGEFLNIDQYKEMMKVNNLSQTALNQVLLISIQNNLGLSFNGEFGQCCCSGYISSIVNNFTKSYVKKIEQEIYNLKVATKYIEMIGQNIDARGYQWNEKIYGNIIASSLAENYLYSKPNYLIEKIDKEQDLLLEANLNTAKNMLLINKMNYYKINQQNANEIQKDIKGR